MKPPYKGDNNTWFTRSLFYDFVVDTPIDQRQDFKPPFTLYDRKPGFICARDAFVELNDPTGYKFAMKYLGDYEHWKTLMKAKWFQEAYDVWMNELKMKIRSESLDVITKIRDEGQPAQALVAGKYLASFEWEKSGRGRPSREELTGELKRQAKILSAEEEDAQRIKLKVVK